MVIIKIEKRHVYVFVALVVLLIGIFVIRAYGSNIPSTFGHSAGEIDVTIGGQTKNLQQAIDNKNIGNVVMVGDIPDANFERDLDDICAKLGGGPNPNQDVWIVYWINLGCYNYCATNGYSGGTTGYFSCSPPSNPGARLVTCLCVK